MFHTKFVQKIKTHFAFNDFFLENRAVYDKTGKNTVERGRPQMTTWSKRIGCYKYTHTGCVILITFPLQQWLHERAWVLRYMYSTWPVLSENIAIGFFKCLCNPCR
jgi:hypothetical protein